MSKSAPAPAAQSSQTLAGRERERYFGQIGMEDGWAGPGRGLVVCTLIERLLSPPSYHRKGDLAHAGRARQASGMFWIIRILHRPHPEYAGSASTVYRMLTVVA